MQRDSKTDLAEPYEVRPSNRRLSCGLWVCNGQNAEQHWQVKDILAIPGETVLEWAIKIKQDVFAIPSHAAQCANTRRR